MRYQLIKNRGINMKYKIGFVVLHYNAIKETIDCVESIKKE